MIIFNLPIYNSTFLDQLGNVVNKVNTPQVVRTAKGYGMICEASQHLYSDTISGDFKTIIFEFYLDNETTSTSVWNVLGSMENTTGAFGFGVSTGLIANETFSWWNTNPNNIECIKDVIPQGHSQIVLVWNSTGYDCWLNGINVTVFSAGTPTMFNNHAVYLGKRQFNAQYFTGKITNCIVADHSFTDTEVASAKAKFDLASFSCPPTRGFENYNLGNYCFQGDGVRNYISIPDDASLDITDKISITSYINLSELSQIQSILSKESYALKINNDDRPYFEIITSDNTSTWTNTGNLAGATHVFSLITFNGKLYAGIYPNGDVFVYDETLDTWTNTGNLAGATYVYSLTTFSGKLYAGTRPNGSVFVYDETLDTWTNTGNLAGATYVFSLITFNGKLYAGIYPNGDVFVYDKTLNTWTNTGNLAGATHVYSLTIFSGKLYAGTRPNGNVFVYDKTLDTWTNTGNLAGATHVYSLTTFSGKLYAGTCPNGDVFVYDKTLDTWTNTGNLAGVSHVLSLTTFSGKLYAGTCSNGDVFVYDKTLDTWTNTGNLAGTTHVYSLTTFNGKLYVGTCSNGDVFTAGLGQASYGIDRLLKNTDYKISAVYDKINIKLYINDVLNITTAYTGTILTNNLDLLIGNSVGASMLNGTIYDVSVNDNGVNKLRLPLVEGHSNKAYDVSGNANHGIITGSDTWTNCPSNNYNREYGCTKVKYNGQKVLVPYLLDKTELYSSVAPVLDASETISEHIEGSWNPLYLHEQFKDNRIDEVINVKDFIMGTGNYKVVEEGLNGKALECTVNGTILKDLVTSDDGKTIKMIYNVGAGDIEYEDTISNAHTDLAWFSFTGHIGTFNMTVGDKIIKHIIIKD